MSFPSDMSKTTINGWSAVRLSAGDVSIGLVPEIGGRIMSLTFRGHEYLYAHAPEQGKIVPLAPEDDAAALKQKLGFRLFGGDKTWVAPEWEWQERIPPLDLDAGPYVLEDKMGAVVMTSSLCRETGLKVTRRVILERTGTIHLEEELWNGTDEAVVKGVWNVSQVPRPFDVYCPAEVEDLRSYHLDDKTLPDPEQVIEYHDGWGRVACRSSVCFKFGGIPRAGRVITVKSFGDETVAWSRSFQLDRNAPYAHKSAVEVFNSNLFNYGEVEVHAPIAPIAPWARVALRQTWRLEALPSGQNVLEAVKAMSLSGLKK